MLLMAMVHLWLMDTADIPAPDGQAVQRATVESSIRNNTWPVDLFLEPGVPAVHVLSRNRLQSGGHCPCLCNCYSNCKNCICKKIKTMSTFGSGTYECSRCKSGYTATNRRATHGNVDKSCKKNKVKCKAGQKRKSETCSSCGANSYQTKTSHRDTSCTAQPACGQGQMISRDSKTSRRACSACPSNTYQPLISHRSTACTTQPTCGRGQSYSAPSTRGQRTCPGCGTNTYQDLISHRVGSCVSQPTCAQGQYYSGPSTSGLRTCSGCGANTYQTLVSHRSTVCTTQPTCGQDQYYSAPSRNQQRTCPGCPPGQHQPTTAPHQYTSCLPIPQAIGYLDSVTREDGRVRLKGWACDYGESTPINVKVYLNGPVGVGEYEAIATAPLANSVPTDAQAVSAACATQDADHAYDIWLPGTRSGTVYVYAITKIYSNDTLLTNSPGSIPISTTTTSVTSTTTTFTRTTTTATSTTGTSTTGTTTTGTTTTGTVTSTTTIFDWNLTLPELKLWDKKAGDVLRETNFRPPKLFAAGYSIDELREAGVNETTLYDLQNPPGDGKSYVGAIVAGLLALFLATLVGTVIWWRKHPDEAAAANNSQTDAAYKTAAVQSIQNPMYSAEAGSAAVAVAMLDGAYETVAPAISAELHEQSGAYGFPYSSCTTPGVQEFYSRVVSLNYEPALSTFNLVDALAQTQTCSLMAAVKKAAVHCCRGSQFSFETPVQTAMSFGRNVLKEEKQRLQEQTYEPTATLADAPSISVFPEGLTATDAGSVHVYTQETPLYSGMNGAFGGWGRDATSATKHYLPYGKLLYTSCSKLSTYSGRLFRGVRRPLSTVLGSKGVGDVFELATFTSTSICSDVLQDDAFLGIGDDLSGQEKVVFQYAVLSGAPINRLTQFRHEDEVLLLPGTKFKIDKITRWDCNVVEVQAHQLPPDVPGRASRGNTADPLGESVSDLYEEVNAYLSPSKPPRMATLPNFIYDTTSGENGEVVLLDDQSMQHHVARDSTAVFYDMIAPTAPTSTTRGGGGSSMIGQPPKRTHQRQEQKHASKPKPNIKSRIAGRSNNRSATLSAGYGHRHYFFLHTRLIVFLHGVYTYILYVYIYINA